MTTTSSIDKPHKIRYAVVGLGAFAQSDALPAFAYTENSELVALVSGDATKRDELAQSGQIGEPRIFTSIFTQQNYEGDIRLDKEIGGGTLDDIGIYCINAARYIFQSEPIAVFATSASNGEPRFREVAEMTSVIMRFPEDRLATFTCSFGAQRIQTYQVVGTKGDLRLELAYSTQGPIKHILTIDGKSQECSFEPHNQLVAEFVHFSDCILGNKQPKTSGTEGLIDVQIIRALYRSIETGGFVQLNEVCLPVAA